MFLANKIHFSKTKYCTLSGIHFMRQTELEYLDYENTNRKPVLLNKGPCYIDTERGILVCKYRENGTRCKRCPIFKNDLIYYIDPLIKTAENIC